jgi:cyclin-like protein
MLLILTTPCSHRLVIASVLVASKMLEDVVYNNKFFAHVGGMCCAEP